METRRRSAQAPEAPPDNQRKKPKADTGAATTVTTNADPDVMALSTDSITPRAFFNTTSCNSATTKRLGGRTVIFKTKK